MRHRLFIFCFSLLSLCKGYSQKQVDINSFTPELGVKTNLIYDATTSLNIGAEIKIGEQYSLDISANYNPWSFSKNKKFKHILLQPELRYWIREPFNGHFWGVHVMYSHYNIGGIKLPLLSEQALEKTRYQGDLYGTGISYGYQWHLSPKWNLEATIGLGYAYLDYKAYECKSCGQELYKKNKHYVGPTKLGLSLIYLIK